MSELTCTNVHPDRKNDGGVNGACVFECSRCGFSINTNYQEHITGCMVEVEYMGGRGALFFNYCPYCGSKIITHKFSKGDVLVPKGGKHYETALEVFNVTSEDYWFMGAPVLPPSKVPRPIWCMSIKYVDEEYECIGHEAVD